MTALTLVPTRCKAPRRLDFGLSGHHRPDQHYRVLFPGSPASAVSHSRPGVADRAGGCDVRTLRSPPGWSVASHVRDQRDDCGDDCGPGAGA